MSALRIPLLAFLGFSVATVLAEAAALTTLWARGNLSKDRAVHIVAIANDVDVGTMWREAEKRRSPQDEDQFSYAEVIAVRATINVDLDLRDIATDKGLNDIRQLYSQLEQERKQYDKLKGSFDLQLERLRKGAADDSMQELQRQIESIDPRLAKDQILRILDDQTIDPDTSMYIVVAMFKGMPLDKRKKILSEFKNEETTQLQEILRQIRLGVPEVNLIRETREKLKEFEMEQEGKKPVAS